MKRLQGKTAIVSAAAQGIGRATVKAFAREGARVIAVDINGEKLNELKNEPGVETYVLNVTDLSAIKEFAAKIENVDILFNCAGYVHHGSILDCDEDAFDFSMNLNVKGMYYMSREFIPKMIKQQKGVILNMSSIVSAIKSAPNRFIYATTKAAIIGLTKSIAVDYIDKGIRCNCICPGTIETESFHDRVNAFPDPEKAMNDFIARQKMGRVGQPEEVANLLVYLASDEATYTTGTEVIIDGGWNL